MNRQNIVTGHEWLDQDVMRIHERLNLSVDETIHMLSMQLESWVQAKESMEEDERKNPA